MAPDGLLVFPEPPGVLDYPATIAAVEASAPWSDVRLTNARVVTPAADAAALTYRAVAHRDGSGEYCALVTTVYARRDGHWRLVLHQQTPLAPASPAAE